MNVLSIILILLIILSAACAVRGLLLKRRNIGFIMMCVLIVTVDVLCCRLIDVKSAKEAAGVLLPYYIVHAWVLFAALLMVILIDRYRKFIVLPVASALLCAYQTYLVICQYKGARIFSFQKRMYFRKAWWVATDDSKNMGLFYSFRSYRIAQMINVALIVAALIICITYTNKILRAQYYAFVGVLIAYFAIEFMSDRFSLPIWMPCLAYNVTSIVCFYLTAVFPTARLKEWSLDSFANDMNDGLVLYDKHNDLIHINDMVKSTLDASLVDSFREKGALEEWIKAGSLSDMNAIGYEKDGTLFYYTVSVKELGGRGGKKIGTLYILHDYTNAVNRIHEVEENNRELERINRMKSDFLTNMSHELHTPMNAVIGMTDIAMQENDPDKIREKLAQIRSSGLGLLNIVNDILDYSKLESGKMDLLSEEFSPFDLFSDISRELFALRGDKDLEVSVSLVSPFMKSLMGDKDRIRQMIVNLASNAVKFTKEGSVRIKAGCEVQPEGLALLSCSVIDTGIGIRNEDMDKLFVSFQQVDGSRSRAAEGTGLGLSIVRGIADAMGGEVDVTSEFGRGSEFKLSLPLIIADGAKDERTVPVAGESEVVLSVNETQDEGPFRPDFTAPDAKVLVVDDNKINLTIASGLMAPLKIYPDTADGGQEAVDKVLSNDYDIVFMDHMMPDTDGVDATKIIRAAMGKDVKPIIVALSANTMVEARNLFLESGMNDFVPKPVDVKLLTETIKKWLPPELIVAKSKAEMEADQAGPSVKVSIDYLDLDGAVRALGSPALYEKIAEEYYRSGRDKYEAIMNAYDSEQWEDYTIKVHALKSSSRQIGALELGAMAEALEKAGKAGDISAIRNGTQECMDAFGRLLEDLSAFYPDEDEDDSDKPAIDAATLSALLGDLESACNDLDMDVMEDISDKLKGYSYEGEAAELVASLQKAISNLDTEECLSLINRLKAFPL